VKWEADTQTAVLHFEGKTIQMPIGSKTVTVDGEEQVLDTAAEFTDGRTMVPLRFVSEVLGSKVEWDDAAHSVRVTDAAYQAKVDSGEATLDPWGREYSRTQDGWVKLTDLNSAEFYNFYFDNSKFLKEFSSMRFFKEDSDILGAKIRNYYEVLLNIDYRTISAEQLIKAFMDSASGKITESKHKKYEYEEMFKLYVAWVKKNKVIAIGYADPELYMAYTAGKIVWIPTHFKFMIISAEDATHSFIDGWEPSASTPINVKKGVWYEGYSEVSMDSHFAEVIWGPDVGIRHTENMFYNGHYFYNLME